MSMVAMGRKADGTLVELPITAGGKLDTSATVEPAAGGATEAKQDDMIAALAGGLPLALSAGGGVKAGLVDAIPAGSNTIGAVTGPSAAALALDSSLITLNAKIPASAALSDSLSNPTTALLGAAMLTWNSGTSQWKRLPGDSTGVPSVISRKNAPTSRSGSTSLQIQRTIAAFSCVPYVVRVWSSTAGYIALANASSAVADGFTPYGGQVYAIEAGKNLTIEFEFRESYTTGLVVVFCTQIHSGTSLSTVIGLTNCCLFTGQYD